jgi:hypothetical protein
MHLTCLTVLIWLQTRSWSIELLCQSLQKLQYLYEKCSLKDCLKLNLFLLLTQSSSYQYTCLIGWSSCYRAAWLSLRCIILWETYFQNAPRGFPSQARSYQRSVPRSRSGGNCCAGHRPSQEAPAGILPQQTSRCYASGARKPNGTFLQSLRVNGDTPPFF